MDDIGKDKNMFLVLLYILMAIMAFVFAVTTNNTITKEANVIGTLRASGYSKGEIVRHYMTTPLLVTVVAALIGNILGYTVFKDLVAGLYYRSYSLTTYRTIWNGNAFVLTTVVPFFIMLFINFIIISRKMSLAPIRFLRRDLAGTGKKRAVNLPDITFFRRFRLRILFQNMSGYFILFIGICFANVLLLFGMMMYPLLEHYKADVLDSQLANYQYVLKVPAETNNTTAEKYGIVSLETTFDKYKSEEISVYGIEEDSRFIDLKMDDGSVYVSDGFADKYGLETGDNVTLKECYKSGTHSFKVKGVYKYSASLAIFMNLDTFNQEFDCEPSYFNGYFSDEQLEDVDKTSIVSTITSEDLTKVTRQLETSMGSIFYLFNVVAVVLYMLVLYLLAKVVIEKNTISISMVKILGYENREIRRLYLSATGMSVVVSLLLSLPVANLIMKAIYRPMIMEMFTGWLPYYIKPVIYPEMFIVGMVTYFVIEVILYQKIKKIPMDEALKNVE